MHFIASFISQLGRTVAPARPSLHRLIVEADGQDIVEYAFLAIFIGCTSWVALNAIVASVGTTYAAWLDPNSGTPAAWEPPPAY